MAGILDIEAGRGAVVAATAALSGLAGSMYAVGNTELGPFFREVDDMIRLGEATRVAILAEALARGVVAARFDAWQGYWTSRRDAAQWSRRPLRCPAWPGPCMRSATPSWGRSSARSMT